MQPYVESGKHVFWTRLTHASLAIIIVLQLLLSLVMHGPQRNKPGDWLFDIHQYVGLAAVFAAFAFWLVIVSRHHGTPKSLMFPWFSSVGRSAFWIDLKKHALALRRLSLPPYQEPAPLASAIHGLGILLMTAMALTGAVYFASFYLHVQDATFVRLSVDAHKWLANLAWAYLIGHAALALLHHYTGHLRMGEMWSIRRSTSPKV